MHTYIHTYIHYRVYIHTYIHACTLYCDCGQPYKQSPTNDCLNNTFQNKHETYNKTS